MQNDWPTMKQDLIAANIIVDKYVDLNEGEPLDFIEVVLRKNNKVEIKVPSWITELSDYFREQYGLEHGHAITSKVITKFLLKNETIH